MYQVFALKYRPQNFDEVIGQPHVIRTLKNSIKAERVVHAYLFSGPRGVGKTTTARLLAKALNCAQGPTAKPCNNCEHCQAIQSGHALDVLEIDGASNRGIDEIRELRERVRYTPAHGRYKIYIIDEVHMLTDQAFNALLKTLEEPPKHVIFIFATTAPYKIPLTILDRCQRFNFRKIAIVEIVARITEIAKLEKIEIDAAASYLIAQKVDGSLRDALSILEQLVPYAEGKIKEEHIREVLGLPAADLFSKLTNYILKRDLANLLTLVRETIDQGIAPKEFISGLTDYLRVLFLFKAGSQVELKLPEISKKQATEFKMQHLLRVIRFLFDTEKDMRGALSPEIYLEQALLKVASCTQVSIDEIIHKIEESGIPSQSHPLKVEESRVPPVSRFTLEPLAQPGTTVKTDNQPTLKTIWESLIKKIEEINPSFSSFLTQGNPVQLDRDTLLVEYKNEFFKTKVEEKLGLVEQELAKLLDHPVHISFKACQKPKSLLEEPIVQTAIKIFNAVPEKRSVK